MKSILLALLFIVGCTRNDSPVKIPTIYGLCEIKFVDEKATCPFSLPLEEAQWERYREGSITFKNYIANHLRMTQVGINEEMKSQYHNFPLTFALNGKSVQLFGHNFPIAFQPPFNATFIDYFSSKAEFFGARKGDVRAFHGGRLKPWGGSALYIIFETSLTGARAANDDLMLPTSQDYNHCAQYENEDGSRFNICVKVQ